jgi:hypothetical protein
MQIKQVFNLLHDSQDLLEFFEGVEDANQLASRLNRLKQGSAPLDLLDTIQALRLSLSEAFNAQIELGGLLSDDNETYDPIDDDLLKQIEFPEPEEGQANDSESREDVSSSTPGSENPST